MSRNALRAASGLAIILLLVTPLAVLAHEEITVGNYTIEYGWVNEPVTARQENAILFNVSAAAAEHTEESGEAGTPTISITSPADGSTVQGEQVEVVIAIEGVDEHADQHYHLSVDDQIVLMAPFDQTAVTLTGLSNGSHSIKAALAESEHTEGDAPATATITVEGSSATGAPTLLSLEATPAEGEAHGDEFAVDVSGLKLEMVYGDQTTALTLQPAASGLAGQYTAPFTPERPGLYTLRITGKLSGSEGEADVNVEVQPEEAMPDPNTATSTETQPGGLNPTTLAIVGVVGVLLVAIIVGAAIFMRRK